MNLSSHLVQRMLRLPPPVTRDLTVERDLRVPMRDGAVLLADRWAPKSGGGLPTALIRIPYGRAGLVGGQMARPLAERGFQVLVQSTRGTFGSDGPFDPLRREREDGLDTIDWVIKQPWFGESMVLYGLSYLGFVQWAVADAVPPQVKAMIPIVSESALTLEFLRADGFSLETPFGWAVQVAGQMTIDFAGHALPSEDSFKVIMAIGCGAALVALLLASFLPRQREGATAHETSAATAAQKA
ncbi:CocE/NonD family hydrolase [Streptomyces sp. NPDC013178]|uniref:CocE/NonD family hydrolase n=1 Tax=unclassified Streptomyces TaxID=2593676 RepID=UPI003400A5B5